MISQHEQQDGHHADDRDEGPATSGKAKHPLKVAASPASAWTTSTPPQRAQRRLSGTQTRGVLRWLQPPRRHSVRVARTYGHRASVSNLRERPWLEAFLHHFSGFWNRHPMTWHRDHGVFAISLACIDALGASQIAVLLNRSHIENRSRGRAGACLVARCPSAKSRAA
jgi:hypothetical protein